MSFRDQHRTRLSAALQPTCQHIIRPLACFTTFLHAAFGVLDKYRLPPETLSHVWIIRFGLLCPFTLGIFLFTYSKNFQQYLQPLLVCWELVAGGGLIIMMALGGIQTHAFYYPGLLLVYMMAYSLICMRYTYATFGGWLIQIMYNLVFCCHQPKIPMEHFLSVNFFLTAGNLTGMAICYTMEYYARRDFLLQQRLREKENTVRRAQVAVNREVRRRTGHLAAGKFGWP